MESPSPKRRKTSPTSSTWVNNGYSSSKKRPVPWPASYLAPTQASLARFNPELLPKEVSTPRSEGSLSKRTSPGFKFRYSGRKKPRETPDRRRILRSTAKAQNVFSRPRELRASPPEPVSVTGSQNPTSTERSGEDRAREIASVTNGHDVEDVLLPGLPDTPSRHEPQDVDKEEPRLPSTPTQLGLEPPPSAKSGGLSRLTPRKSKRQLRLPPEPSPLKPRIWTPDKDGNYTPGNIIYTTIDGFHFDSLDSHAHAKDQILKVIETRMAPQDEQGPTWTCRRITLVTLDDILEVELYVRTHSIGIRRNGLNVLRISTWAGSELNTPLRALAASGSIISIRCSILEYLKMAKERAQCWAQCARNVCGSVPLDNTNQPNIPDGIPQDMAHEDNLYELLGRQNLLISRHGVTLVFNWKIVDCAEIKPRRVISVRMVFENEDEEAEVGKPETRQLRETLDALIDNGMDIAQAIEVVVRTVFSDDDGM
ncbi:MAG: hypothetical protein Q9222_007842 [Ikaeria aurantiellina]